jgi:hypothetical protein
MTLIVSLFFALLLQAPVAVPGQKVIVGLDDGQQIIVADPEFSGFIEGRSGDAILMYRQENFHGEMPLRTIQRIEFGDYRKGKPFQMTVTLRNGQKLQVENERREFVTLKGKTDFGMVTVRHPDPISNPVNVGTRKPNRRKDLTIHFLEVPAS